MYLKCIILLLLSHDLEPQTQVTISLELSKNTMTTESTDLTYFRCADKMRYEYNFIKINKHAKVKLIT